MIKSLLASIKVDLKELIRKKDFYVLLIFLVIILVSFARQDIFGLVDPSRYLVDIGYTFVTIFSVIIAVSFTARQLPKEIENKTIYPLLAKPVSRFNIVLFRYAGSLFISVFSFTVFYAVFTGFYFSFVAGRSGLVLLAQSYLLGVFSLMMISAVVIFLSNFVTVGANVALSLVLYAGIIGFIGQLRETFMAATGADAVLWGAFYHIVPHFEFFDMRVRLTHQWDSLSLWVMTSVIVYATLYSLFLLFLSGAVFSRKRL